MIDLLFILTKVGYNAKLLDKVISNLHKIRMSDNRLYGKMNCFSTGGMSKWIIYKKKEAIFSR